MAEIAGAYPVRTCGRAVGGIAFALTGVGVLMIYSASTFWGAEKFGDPTHFLKRQLIGVALGAVAFLVCARVPYEVWAKRSAHLLVVALLLLALVLVVGSRFNGARRWLRFLGFGFQPSELAKLAVIVHAAAFLGRPREGALSFRRGFLRAIVPIALLSGLTLVEPDFGTALFIAALGVIVLIVGGQRVLHFAVTGVALLPIVTWVMCTHFDYIKARLAPFFAGETGYQVQQGFIAMGSGGLIGRGIGAGAGKLFFLPEVAGDFIFPSVGEEIGFLGVLLVVVLFMAFTWFGFRVALGALPRDRFAFLLVFGITAWIAMQAALNMAVVSGLAPTKGIALPFISYGSSSLVVGLAAVGIVVNVAGRFRRPECGTSEAGS